MYNESEKAKAQSVMILWGEFAKKQQVNFIVYSVFV